MGVFVALLRAVNVGGTGKLPMADLKSMCLDAGFTNVRTYIASGNVVFGSKLAAAKVKATLEKKLLAYAGKPVGVLLRTPEEMAAVLKANPFPNAAPNRLIVVFLDDAMPDGWRTRVKGLKDEKLHAHGTELFVHYGDGMGQSKLSIPDAKTGTGRNLNTVAKLAEMAAEQPG